MNNEDIGSQRKVEKKPPIWRRDRPGCLKYIILLFLILLLLGEIAAGEFRGFPDLPRLTWVILFVKLFLIAVMIVLIRIQRHLYCTLTDPTGCTEEEPDPGAGILTVRVRGTAAGGAFGSYTLEVRKVGFPTPIAGIVSYPGGGASGNSPVIAGELGVLDTTGLNDDAYEITLSVYPAWAGPPKTCSITFNLLKAIVYISRIAGVQAISDTPTPGNANPFDEAAELRDASNNVVSVGGVMTLKGAAYVYECPSRKIRTYDIRYQKVAAPGPEPGQPNTGDPIPASFTGVITHLDYATSGHYKPWTRVGPAAMDLVNTWKTFTIGGTTYFKLSAGAWNSWPVSSGRYSLLLTAEDTTGVTYHDIQHIWLDNHNILGKIVELQWMNPRTGIWEKVPHCTDLSMKVYRDIRIVGLAWDPLIDEAWWTSSDPLTRPNDNFGHYRVRYKKQFQSWNILIDNVTSRVPALPSLPPVAVPTDADADNLFTWNLASLDAGPPPTPGAIAPGGKLYRGESCSFTLELFVTDTTVVPDGPDDHHQTWDIESVNIVNDL